MKSILDPTFRYTPSVQTDIRKTFARVKRERRQQEEAEAAAREEAERVVTPLTRKAAK